MSFISTLTWSCIEIQSVIENPDVSEAEKNASILKHLSSLEECTDREAFPEFDLGESWIEVLRYFLSKYYRLYLYFLNTRMGMV